jgi:hypothetical protein
MTNDQDLPPVGSAVAGAFVAHPSLRTLPCGEPVFLNSVTSELFTVDADESLRTREERRFFDWGVGILEDAGICGVLKNDYVYQAATLHGEIHTGAGRPYAVTLSRTSVEFEEGGSEKPPVHFAGGSFETDGDDLEASQVGCAFDTVRRQSALIRAWKNCTSMRSTHSILFKELRILFGEPGFAMDVETDLGEFTVTIRRTSNPDVFRYSLTGAETPIVHSPRVADALLSDAAEEAGGDPEPAAILGAMIRATWLASQDPEWLAVQRWSGTIRS